MEPIVFLPGTLCDERLWHHQTAVFETSHVVDLRIQDQLEAMLIAVAEAPFETFALVGFSMGGYVAQEFALRFPERVRKLILMGSSCEGYPEDEKEIVLKALPQIERGLFQGLTEKRLRQFLHPRSYEDPHIRELIHSMTGPDAGSVYLRQLKATLNRRNLSNEIKSLPCPIHAIAGKEDRIVSVESILRIERYVPRADIHVLPDCGHFIPLERPDQVNELLFQFMR